MTRRRSRSASQSSAARPCDKDFERDAVRDCRMTCHLCTRQRCRHTLSSAEWLRPPHGNTSRVHRPHRWEQSCMIVLLRGKSSLGNGLDDGAGECICVRNRQGTICCVCGSIWTRRDSFEQPTLGTGTSSREVGSPSRQTRPGAYPPGFEGNRSSLINPPGCIRESCEVRRPERFGSWRGLGFGRTRGALAGKVCG